MKTFRAIHNLTKLCPSLAEVTRVSDKGIGVLIPIGRYTPYAINLAMGICPVLLRQLDKKGKLDIPYNDVGYESSGTAQR